MEMADDDTKSDVTKKLRDDIDACLVESVKSYPVIYDPNDTNYRNNFRKSQAWLQVVEDLRKRGYECSETFCRKRYWALKKRFRVKKEAEELPEETTIRREKSFPLYQKMDYLHSVIEEPNCTSSSLVALEESGCSLQTEKKDSRELTMNSTIPNQDDFTSPLCPPRSGRKRRSDHRIAANCESRVTQFGEENINLQTLQNATLVDPRWIDILNSFGFLSRELSDAGFMALKRRVVPTLSQMLATALAEEMSPEQSVDGSQRVPFVTLVAKPT
uniref:MADF domain-containing protein n=1 Tax=Syphacia muris TaxID=451379 RepID=A0A0N5ATF2_9BILA